MFNVAFVRSEFAKTQAYQVLNKSFDHIYYHHLIKNHLRMSRLEEKHGYTFLFADFKNIVRERVLLIDSLKVGFG